MENIVANGLGTIRVGLEDFEQEARDSARLTSAVRNVYAGILILAKSKLYELSPPGTNGILIRVVRPKLVHRRLELVPEGSKTIEYPDIKERFRHFGLTLDWEKIERIRAIRNDLEHFYHAGSGSNVREALADAATVIRSLLTLLNLDPINDLGQRSWDILLRNKRLFDDELAVCRASLAGITWFNGSATAASEHLSCSECRSPLIKQLDAENADQDHLRLGCAACGFEHNMEVAMEHAATNQHYAELYEAHTRGGELPVIRCPECRHSSMVMETGECVACGFTLGQNTN